MMKLLIPFILLFSAVCAFAQEEAAEEKPTKLPDEPRYFNYGYKADDVEGFGVHMADGVYVLFSAFTRADDESRRYYYAYKITPELNREGGLEGAVLLSRQLDEARYVYVNSPGDELPGNKRTVKLLDRIYLVVGSLSYLK